MNRQIPFCSGFKGTRLASLPSKSLNITGISSFSQKLSTWVTAESNVSTTIDFLLLKNVTFLRAFMTPDSNIFAEVLHQHQGIVELMRDKICPDKERRGQKCVSLTSFEEINKSTNECKQCNACSHVLNIPSVDQKLCGTSIGWTYCFRKKTKLDYEKQKLSPVMRQYIHQSALSFSRQKQRKLIINFFQKGQRYYLIMNNRVTLLLLVSLEHKCTLLFVFKTVRQLTTPSFTISTMQYTVSNNGRQ